MPDIVNRVSGEAVKKATGSTIEAGFETGARMTIDAPPQEVWRFITGPGGIEIWLGSVSELRLEKGQTYETEDGTTGEIRSVREGQKLRLTWKPPGWQRPSTLQISIVPTGRKASVRFHQENLSDEALREKMRRHWKDTLSRLRKAIS